MKKFKVLGLVLSMLAVLVLWGCGSDDADNDNNDVDTEVVEETGEEPEEEEPDYLTLGSTFEFDDLEITIGTDIEWVTVENQFSDHDGADVIQLPITITNLSDDTHGLNMFFFTFFGSNGTRLDGVSSFFDNSVDFAGDMRSGATQESYMYILFDGDGEYVIEFNDWSETIEVIFNITQ